MNASLLVVDDDETALQYHFKVLATANFAVRFAKCCDEALEMLAHGAFDVVLLEPAMSGGDALAALCAIKDLCPDTEVLVITRAPSIKNAKEAIRLGACDYLTKPVAPDQLILAAARAALQKKWALHRIPARDPVQLTH